MHVMSLEKFYLPSAKRADKKEQRKLLLMGLQFFTVTTCVYTTCVSV